MPLRCLLLVWSLCLLLVSATRGTSRCVHMALFFVNGNCVSFHCRPSSVNALESSVFDSAGIHVFGFVDGDLYVLHFNDSPSDSTTSTGTPIGVFEFESDASTSGSTVELHVFDSLFFLGSIESRTPLVTFTRLIMSFADSGTTLSFHRRREPSYTTHLLRHMPPAILNVTFQTAHSSQMTIENGVKYLYYLYNTDYPLVDSLLPRPPAPSISSCPPRDRPFLHATGSLPNSLPLRRGHSDCPHTGHEHDAPTYHPQPPCETNSSVPCYSDERPFSFVKTESSSPETAPGSDAPDTPSDSTATGKETSVTSTYSETTSSDTSISQPSQSPPDTAPPFGPPNDSINDDQPDNPEHGPTSELISFRIALPEQFYPHVKGSFVNRNMIYIFFDQPVFFGTLKYGDVPCSQVFLPITVLSLGGESRCLLLHSTLYIQPQRIVPSGSYMSFISDVLRLDPHRLSGLRASTKLIPLSTLLVSSSAALDNQYNSIKLTFSSPLDPFMPIPCSLAFLNDNLGSDDRCVVEFSAESPYFATVFLGTGATILASSVMESCSVDYFQFSTFLYFTGYGMIQSDSQNGAYGCITVTSMPLKGAFVMPSLVFSNQYSSICDSSVLIYAGESQLHSRQDYQCRWSSSTSSLDMILRSVTDCLMNLSIDNFADYRTYQFTVSLIYPLIPPITKESAVISIFPSVIAHVTLNIPLNFSFFFDQEFIIIPTISFGHCSPKAYGLHWEFTCGPDLSAHVLTNGSIFIRSKTFDNIEQTFCLYVVVLDSENERLGSKKLVLRQLVSPIVAYLPSTIVMGSSLPLRIDDFDISYVHQSMSYRWVCRALSEGAVCPPLTEFSKSLLLENDTLVPDSYYELAMIIEYERQVFRRSLILDVRQGKYPVVYLNCNGPPKPSEEIIYDFKTSPPLDASSRITWRTSDPGRVSFRLLSSTRFALQPMSVPSSFSLKIEVAGYDDVILEESVPIPRYTPGHFVVYPQSGNAFETMFTVEFRGLFQISEFDRSLIFDSMNTYQFGIDCNGESVPLSPVLYRPYFLTMLPAGVSSPDHSLQLYVDVHTQDGLFLHCVSDARSPSVLVHPPMFNTIQGYQQYLAFLRTTVFENLFQRNPSLSEAIIPQAIVSFPQLCDFMRCQHGKCMNGTCVCSPGYEGLLCDTSKAVDGEWSEWIPSPCVRLPTSNLTLLMRICAAPFPQGLGLSCLGSHILLTTCDSPLLAAYPPLVSYPLQNVSTSATIWSHWSPCFSRCFPDVPFCLGQSYRFGFCISLGLEICAASRFEIEYQQCQVSINKLGPFHPNLARGDSIHEESVFSIGTRSFSMSQLRSVVESDLSDMVDFAFNTTSGSSFSLTSYSLEYLTGFHFFLRWSTADNLLSSLVRLLNSVSTESSVSTMSYRTFLKWSMDITADELLNSRRNKTFFRNPWRESLMFLVNRTVQLASGSLARDGFLIRSESYSIAMNRLYPSCLPHTFSFGMIELNEIPIDTGQLLPTEFLSLGIGVWHTHEGAAVTTDIPLYISKMYHRWIPYRIPSEHPLVFTVYITREQHSGSISCNRLYEPLQGVDTVLNGSLLNDSFLIPLLTLEASLVAEDFVSLTCLSFDYGRFLFSSTPVPPIQPSPMHLHYANLFQTVQGKNIFLPVLFYSVYFIVIIGLFIFAFVRDRRMQANLDQKRYLVYIFSGTMKYSYQENSLMQSFKNSLLYMHSLFSLFSYELHPYLSYSCKEHVLILLCLSATNLGCTTLFLNHAASVYFTPVPVLVVTPMILAVFSYMIPMIIRNVNNIQTPSNNTSTRIPFNRSFMTLRRYRTVFHWFGFALIMGSLYPVLPIMAMFGASWFALVLFCGYTIGLTLGLLVFYDHVSRYSPRYFSLFIMFLIMLIAVIAGLVIVIEFYVNPFRMYLFFFNGSHVMRTVIDSIERFFLCLGVANTTDLAVNSDHLPYFAMLDSIPTCNDRLRDSALLLELSVASYMVSIVLIYLGLMVTSFMISRLLLKTYSKSVFSEPHLVRAAKVLQRWYRRLIGVKHGIRRTEFHRWVRLKGRVGFIVFISHACCFFYILGVLFMAIDSSLNYSMTDFSSLVIYFTANSLISVFFTEPMIYLLSVIEFPSEPAVAPLQKVSSHLTTSSTTIASPKAVFTNRHSPPPLPILSQMQSIPPLQGRPTNSIQWQQEHSNSYPPAPPVSLEEGSA